MDSREQLRLAEMARARAVKRRNALTAGATGALLAWACAEIYGFHSGFPGWAGMGAGLVLGLLYANAFEYVLHRYLLHWGNGFLVQRHALHHDSAGAPEEARYVNFATSHWVVVLVFLLNAPPVFAAGRLLGGALASGMFAGFTIYYAAYEEIHWRIHLGGLPRWLGYARRHHMLHHGGFEGRYNVFLPIFDWLCSRRHWKQRIPASPHPH